MRTIRSPVNGVVVEVLLKPGEFGAITFKDPILRWPRSTRSRRGGAAGERLRARQRATSARP